MKEWCLQHPYLTFFVVMSAITTLGNVITKIVDIFVKPAPTTVNMSIDPTKIPGFNSSQTDDGIVH